MLLLSALLLACAPEAPPADAPAPLADDAAPPPLALNVTPDPVAGAPITLTLTGAPPRAGFAFVAANGGVQQGWCPPRLQGACLGIAPGTLGYRRIHQGTTDAQGAATFTTTVPAQITPGPYDFQAVIGSPQIALSNPVEVTIRSVCDDAAEPNDVEADATPLTADLAGMNACFPGDEDWYAVDVPPASAVSISAAFSVADGDLDLELYSAAGVRLDGSYRLTSPEEVLWYNAALTTTTVYVFAYAVTDPQQNGVAYDLDLETVTPQPCVDDALEPDDTLGAAAPITVGAHTGHTACDQDADWYWIDVQASEQLSVTVTEPTGAGDVDVQIYNAAGAPLGRGGDEAEYISATAQRLYFAVTLVADDIAGLGNTYDLDVDVTPVTPCAADALEPNDNTAQATVGAPGSWTALEQCADADWYAVTVQAGEVIDVSMYFARTDGDIDATVYDANNAVVGGGAAGGDNEFFTVTATTAGTYYIKVFLYADGGPPVTGGARYDLTIDVLPAPTPCAADAFEPNDDAQHAAPVGPGSWAALEQCADADWYAVPVQAGQTLHVDLTFPVADGDIDATVYDANNRQVGGGAAGGDNEVFDVRAAATGTLFIKVFLYGDYGPPVSGGARYDMDLSVR